MPYTTLQGIRFLNLQRLVELKLASGMPAPHPLKDLADVQELIRVLNLSREFSDQLDASVRDKFVELWQAVRDAPAE